MTTSLAAVTPIWGLCLVFRCERENLKQLRISLERERAVERDRMETQMAESKKQLQEAKRELTNVLVYLKEEWNTERLKLS